jgi:UDP-perosamine 4-acetyltransferase
MIKVVGLGAGGHGRVVLEALMLLGGVEVVCFLDSKESLWEKKVAGIPVLGGDELLPKLFDQGVKGFFIGLGSISDLLPRKRLYEKSRSYGYEAIPVIHPHAVVSPSAKIDSGVTMMAGAIVNTQAKIGENVLINTGAIVEHDCVIGSHVHVATGAKLASTVHVGEGTHIGLGACIKQSCRIGKNVIVGAGAVVVNDVPDDVVVVGIPGRILRKRRRADD